MAVKQETSLQTRVQAYVKKCGGYIKKNHGNMITEVGRSDLSFTYLGLSFYWEVKTPDTRHDVSQAQGIHIRLAKKAGGLTAIISNMTQAADILNHIDYCIAQRYPVEDIIAEHYAFMKNRGLDDGTSY